MARKNVSPLLTFLLLSCLALSVFGIDAGVLGISWNVQLAIEPADNPRHKHVWMLVVEFDKNVVDIFSDEEIVGLARRGFDDMNADFSRNDPPWKDPTNNIGTDQPKGAPLAMSAIAFGQRPFCIVFSQRRWTGLHPFCTCDSQRSSSPMSNGDWW
jgi:hypothetical protein